MNKLDKKGSRVEFWNSDRITGFDDDERRNTNFLKDTGSQGISFAWDFDTPIKRSTQNFYQKYIAIKMLYQRKLTDEIKEYSELDDADLRGIYHDYIRREYMFTAKDGRQFTNDSLYQLKTILTKHGIETPSVPKMYTNINNYDGICNVRRNFVGMLHCTNYVRRVVLFDDSGHNVTSLDFSKEAN